MDSETKDALGVLLIAAFFGALVSIATYSMTRNSWRNAAIEAGVAEFHCVDKTTGQTEFVWLGNESEGK